MKTWKITVPVIALLVLMAASASAATKTHMSTGGGTGKWTFGIDGGGTFPTGDYKDLANTGFNIGGMADYWMNSTWGLGVNAAYHATNGSDDLNAALVADPAFGAGSEAKWSTIEYGVHATYLIPTQGQIAPYVQAGAAGYNVKFKIDGGLAPGDESVNKVGFNFGAGADFHATPVVNLGIGAKYYYVPSDTEFGDKSINWFGVQGRVTFKMPTK